MPRKKAEPAEPVNPPTADEVPKEEAPAEEGIPGKANLTAPVDAELLELGTMLGDLDGAVQSFARDGDLMAEKIADAFAAIEEKVAELENAASASEDDVEEWDGVFIGSITMPWSERKGRDWGAKRQVTREWNDLFNRKIDGRFEDHDIVVTVTASPRP